MQGSRLSHSMGIYLIELLAGANDLKETEKALEFMLSAIVGDAPFAFLTDATNGPLPDVKTRAIFTAFINSHADELQRNCAGWAIVTKSKKMRMAHKAMGWILPRSYPSRIFSELADAQKWLQNKIDDRK